MFVRLTRFAEKVGSPCFLATINSSVLSRRMFSGSFQENTDPSLPRCAFDNGVYVTPFGDKGKGFCDVLRWKLTSKSCAIQLPNVNDNLSLIKSRSVDYSTLNTVTEKPHLTWMGHASCFFQADGVRFLTDPLWSSRAAPVQFAGPKRFVEPPCDLSKLDIDIVLLSHTHYDHLDYDSAMSIGNKALWIVPKGVKEVYTIWVYMYLRISECI